jgi:hypothetical protein
MSLESSLGRLGLDRVDVSHLHNPITENGGGLALRKRHPLRLAECLQMPPWGGLPAMARNLGFA